MNLGTGKSRVDSSIYVTGMPNLKSISPSSGSIYGGTVLTLTGNGFTTGTSVLLDSSVCTVISATLDTLTCLTSNHADGTASLTVR